MNFNKPAHEFINYSVEELTHESSLVCKLTDEVAHDTQETSFISVNDICS